MRRARCFRGRCGMLLAAFFVVYIVASLFLLQILSLPHMSNSSSSGGGAEASMLFPLLNSDPTKWTEQEVLTFLEATGQSSTVINMAKSSHLASRTLLQYEGSFLQKELGVGSVHDEHMIQTLLYLHVDGYRPPGMQKTGFYLNGESTTSDPTNVNWLPPLDYGVLMAHLKRTIEGADHIRDESGVVLTGSHLPTIAYVMAKDEHFVYAPRVNPLPLVLGDRNVTVETLFFHPPVFRVHGLLTRDECEFLIDTGRDNLKQMGEAWRTCTTAFIKDGHHPRVSAIGELIDRLTKIPSNLRETMHLLRFEKGQFHLRHHDYNIPEKSPNYGPRGNKANRLLTVYVDLSEDVLGGELCFPAAAAKDENADKSAHNECGCSTYQCIPPRIGTATLFYSLLPGLDSQQNGEVDSRTLHQVCPVVTGNKWVAAFFVRSKLGVKQTFFGP